MISLCLVGPTGLGLSECTDHTLFQQLANLTGYSETLSYQFLRSLKMQNAMVGILHFSNRRALPVTGPLSELRLNSAVQSWNCDRSYGVDDFDQCHGANPIMEPARYVAWYKISVSLIWFYLVAAHCRTRMIRRGLPDTLVSPNCRYLSCIGSCWYDRLQQYSLGSKSMVNTLLLALIIAATPEKTPEVFIVWDIVPERYGWSLTGFNAPVYRKFVVSPTPKSSWRKSA